MGVSKSQLNKFLFFKLPSAFLCGVRVKHIDSGKCVTSAKHRWINQNPFNSMYFAVQAMAAELSTGALVINEIKENGQNISMLVATNKAVFTKKATGRITFTCNDGEKIRQAIQQAVETRQGVTCWMQSVAVNEKGEQVSVMDFEWTLKAK
ncbi:MAG: DUF4442 domain-containing protein [Flavobacterium sp.]|uniref:DUF4442 domain-containing protein n=1 Tax=Flavobacterium sp. TaxID=239 RepID=UPI001228A854|nr:DUF4442 domain-containing protein [Flavobacterium sp.]RZJ67030.1 MAG: DUF4442 domain-containing protein [Flavobacterium sp.]